MSFSRQANPVWLFTDLNGNILDDTYYMSFLENTFPYLPQSVYQDDQGVTPWSNPLQFNPDGTLPNNLYFEDGAVYRLEIRQGPTQSDPLIRLIENFVANDSANPSDITLPIDNQITNPQFAFISFNEELVITNTGNNSYDIAPGWVLDLESGGSAVLTVSRIALAGDENIPTGEATNPAYVLSFEITSGTFTSVQLRQRFNHSPAIWAGSGVSINFTGKMLANSADIIVRYVPSGGTEPSPIISASLSSVYQFIAGGIQLSDSDNPDTGENGYVDIIFDLPIAGTCFLTNIQVIGSTQAAVYPYAQTTVERQRDHTFHNYYDSIIQQPKSSLLTGWNFALNPWQFRSSSSSNVANNTYTADQTIIVQQKYVESASGNNIAVERGTAAENYAFIVKAVTATNKFAMIQYLDPSTIRPYWGTNLSSLVKALISSPTHNTECKFKLRLIYKAGLPSTISQTEPIATWLSSGEPVFAAGWTSISPLNDPEYTFGDGSFAFAFDQFELPASSNDNMTLGIVLYTTVNLVETATADRLLFNNASLVANDYAIESQPETFDESLRKCQFYYEKSYALSVLPGTISDANQKLVRANTPYNGAASNLFAPSFNLEYQQAKRGIPSVTFYSNYTGVSGDIGTAIVRSASNPAAVGSNPQNVSIGSGSGWNLSIGQRSTTLTAKDTGTPIINVIAGAEGDEAIVTYQYVADSRLGI